MNERIRQLADRLWRVHPADIDAMGLKTRTEFYEHELTKFAELIVRECANVELYWLNEHDRKSVAEKIKEHFGVE